MIKFPSSHPHSAKSSSGASSSTEGCQSTFLHVGNTDDRHQASAGRVRGATF